MIWPAVALVLTLLTAAAPADARGSDPIVIGVLDGGRESGADDSTRGDVRRGIDFGLIEMAQTSKLLGREVRMAAGSEPPYGLIVIGEERPQPGVPAVHIGPPPTAPADCEFGIGLTAPSGPAEGGAPAKGAAARRREVLWHPTLDRFGASELNERYERQYEVGMSAEAWAGWVAVKALVESALRRRPDESPCAALARLRLDGHKGRPLYFDTTSRVLVQPVYVIEGGRVVGERK